MRSRRAGNRPTGLTSVLAAIARTAARVCEATDVLIHLVDGDRHRLVAKHGRLAHVQRLGDTHAIRRDTPLGLAVLHRRPVHVRDIATAVRTRFRGLAQLGLYNRRIRTILVMPLLEAGTARGAMVIRRTRVQPFTAKQIALLQTFADQAVIAIENVRLFSELQERTDELGRSVEQLRALSEVGQAVSSTLDLDAVLQAIVARAAQLAGTRGASIWEYDELGRGLPSSGDQHPRSADRGDPGRLGHPQGRGRDRAGRAHQGPGSDPRRQRGRGLRGTAPGRAPSRGGRLRPDAFRSCTRTASSAA